jgi:PAS domain S-box-containing protein
MSNEEDPSGAFRQPSFMRLLLDHMPNQIFWKDRSLRYVGCNQAFAEVVGLDRPEDICGLTDFDFARDDREARNYQADDRAVLETGTPIIEREERYDTADGREGVVDTTKLPIRDGENRIVGLLGICVDVTERKQAEATQTALAERLHQSQKLDAIGQLAGGIAHDFNSMLAGILSASELIQELVSAEDAASLRYLQLIRRSVKHASNLTGNCCHSPAGSRLTTHPSMCTRWLGRSSNFSRTPSIGVSNARPP